MNFELKKLSNKIWVTGQIMVSNIANIKAQGFNTIINNRFDGENEGQPSAESIRTIAEQAGLKYVYLPIEPGKPTEDAILGFSQAINDCSGAVLAHCGTGMRAAVLWALSQVGQQSADDLISTAKQAGYDISAVRPRLI